MLAFIFGLTPQSQSLPSAFKGTGLYRQCKAAIRAQEPNASLIDTAAGAVCLGYINGYLDGLDAGAPQKSICVNGATLITIVRVYVLSMDRHPKLMDEPENYGVGLALEESYPCKK